jgi:hypothetical protein
MHCSDKTHFGIFMTVSHSCQIIKRRYILDCASCKTVYAPVHTELRSLHAHAELIRSERERRRNLENRWVSSTDRLISACTMISPWPPRFPLRCFLACILLVTTINTTTPRSRRALANHTTFLPRPDEFFKKSVENTENLDKFHI